MAEIHGTKGWYEKYLKFLKVACKWCNGEKRVPYTMKLDPNGAHEIDKEGATHTGKKLEPYWVECPRCGATGDEPDLGRSQVRIHA